MMGVYAIVNKVFPERMYIGSSKNVEERINQHFSQLKRGEHYNLGLQKDYDWNGDGKDDFSVFFLERVIDKQCLHKIEDNWIQKFLDAGHYLYNNTTFRTPYLITSTDFRIHRDDNLNENKRYIKRLESEIDFLISQIEYLFEMMENSNDLKEKFKEAYTTEFLYLRIVEEVL